MKRYPRGTSFLGSWVQNAERVAVSPLAGFVTVCWLLEGSYSTLQTAKQRGFRVFEPSKNQRSQGQQVTEYSYSTSSAIRWPRRYRTDVGR